MHTKSQFRLLVVRLSAMGDILHALPAVTALREAHPGWGIDWVVEPAWKALLSAEQQSPESKRSKLKPLVDRVYSAATRRWVREPFSRQTRGELGALRRELRAAGYDAVLDLQGSVRSAITGRLSGCCRRIGEAEPRESLAKWVYTERVATTGAHVVEQDLELAAAVAGDALTAVRPLLPVDPDAEAWCASLLDPSAGKPLALLHPGAGWGAKRWPAERYGVVAAGLGDAGYSVLVNAGPGEEPLAEAVRVQSGGVATPVSSSLGQLIALTRKVSLVIGGDTGPLHLACALQKPVVGIYGPTDPSRNGPFGTSFRVLRNPDSRRDHSRHAEPEAGLLTISPGDVLRAAEELMARETVA